MREIMIEPKSKIFIVLVSCCLGIFLLVGIYFWLSNSKASQVAPTFRSHQTRSVEKPKVPSEESKTVETSATREEKMSVLSEEQTVKAFAESYINYESINERNANLLSFVTEVYAQENALTAPITANITSSGQVLALFQDKANPQKWLAQVEQEQDGTSLAYMLELELDEQCKISQMIYHLYKLAY